METRKITIIHSPSQSKYVIETNATTLLELKDALKAHKISFNNLSFYEGLSKTELLEDNSFLPKDVPYKGRTTNELVFMLTTKNKKITSGLCLDRKAAILYIKENALQEKVKTTFGKNFTNCKTEDLNNVITEYERFMSEQDNISSQEDSTEIMKIKKAITTLVTYLVDYGCLNPHYRETILEQLSVSNTYNKNQAVYSDKELDEIFEFTGI